MTHEEKVTLMILAGGIAFLAFSHKLNVPAQQVMTPDSGYAPWFNTYNAPMPVLMSGGNIALPQTSLGADGGNSAPCSTCSLTGAGYSSAY